MSAFVANNAVLNAAATPFTPSFETAAPYDVEQHLYDSPANIAHDNQVAISFLTAHNAPTEFWEQAGYEDPRLSGPVVQAQHPGAVRLLDAMEREREDRIAKLEKRVDLMHLSSDISDTSAMGLIVPTPLASPQSSLRHRQDQGVPLPPSPPWSPAPVRQMVERSQKKKTRKSPMTRSGQRCRPSDKSRQVRMKLKVEVAGLQDRYGFSLVSAALSDMRREIKPTPVPSDIKGALARRDEKTEELENVVAVLTAQVESLQDKTCNCKEGPKLVGQGTANVPFELEYADEVVLPSPNPSSYATPLIENAVPVPTPGPASTLAASDKENCGRCVLQPIHQLVKIEDEVMEVYRAKDAPRVAELSRMVTSLVEVESEIQLRHQLRLAWQDPTQGSDEGDGGLLADYVDSAVEQSPGDGDVGPGVPEFGDIWEADWSA
ncbi:hypothetical protein BJ322DRAFT_1109145 [Thelephora terrestris]|uniref:Uncharacterized protein n=1 Tax=Thelephora terrestris TaxID=56493 RepID=A0A9P6L5L5_9AGAM|nr:hypothetical protein BJ322DRAFT_1109145 [Thelephora terrestris]